MSRFSFESDREFYDWLLGKDNQSENIQEKELVYDWLLGKDTYDTKN